MWMWGALLAYNLPVWLQMLAPLGAAKRREAPRSAAKRREAPRSAAKRRIATVCQLLPRRAARWTATACRHKLHFTAEASKLIAQVRTLIHPQRHLLSA
jgi:hypothetical protein